MTTPTLEFFTIERHRVEPPQPGEFRILTAAVMSCGLCGKMIDGMGGGGAFICLPCGEALEQGRLVGCVKWDE